VVAAHVTAADVGDRDGAAELWRRLGWRALPRLRHGWVDQGYRGAFVDWVRSSFGLRLEVVQRPDGGRRGRWLPPGVTPPTAPSFAVVPRRWVVERTFAWLGRFRRLSRDDEFLTATSQAVICLAMSQVLVRRLAGSAASRQHRPVRPAAGRRPSGSRVGAATLPADPG
jgi:transposase